MGYEDETEAELHLERMREHHVLFRFWKDHSGRFYAALDFFKDKDIVSCCGETPELVCQRLAEATRRLHQED